MQVTAHARYIHMSPRKVRLIAGLVRGMNLDLALRQLRFANKGATLPVRKLLESAMANAVHNHKLVPEQLFVKSITVDGGPVLKRMRPRAFGRGADIKKRTSHISVILDERSVSSAPQSVTAATVQTETGKAETKPAKKSKKEVSPKTA